MYTPVVASAMKLGQTSIVHFLSRLFSAVIGFFATLYVARILGAEPLGIYTLAISLVSWLAIVGKAGVSSAISKRVSEGENPTQYGIAGGLIIGLLGAIAVTGLLIFRPIVNSYIGYPATGFIIIILLVTLSYSLVNPLLTGLHLVHIQGILNTVRTTTRSFLQITAVYFGLNISGLFIGHIAGFAVAFLIGIYFVTKTTLEFRLPNRQNFSSLLNFAKFSWLGTLRSQMYSYTDIIVLGFFVPSALVGVYSAAWNISTFLILFSGSLRSTLFPEISELTTEQDTQAASRIVEQFLTFGGLFLIPGLLGGAILGERILRIYGPEFTQGALILVILIMANLLMGYQTQFLNTLNAVDHPDSAFRVNAVFVGANLILNVVLVSQYGWVGAAVATTASVAISLIMGYYLVSQIIDFSVPLKEIGKQWAAALIMALVVSGGLYVENTYRLLSHNIATVLLLVGVGAAVYFLVLLGLSTEFREVVQRNAPNRLPFV